MVALLRTVLCKNEKTTTRTKQKKNSFFFYTRRDLGAAPFDNLSN